MSPKYLSFLAEIQALCLQLERAEDLYAAAALAKESKLSSKPPNGPLKKAENAPALRLDEMCIRDRSHICGGQAHAGSRTRRDRPHGRLFRDLRHYVRALSER